MLMVMASTALMNPRQPPSPAMRPPPAPPMEPRHPSSSVRRWQARGHLSSQIKDRSASGPVKWNRSLTEVNISNYKSHCRDFGDRHLYTRRGNLPAASFRKDNRSTESNSTVEEYIYKPALNGNKRRPSVDSSEVASSKECIKHLTIAELHKLLGKPETQKQRLGADDMKIVINSVPSAYPNIKVTFKDQEPNEAEAKKGVKLPAVGPVSSGGQRKNGLSQSAPFKMASALEPTRRLISDMPLSTKACLAQLEKSRVNPSEWTKRWVADSPLGPARNDEYERAADESSSRLSDKIKHSKSPEESETQSQRSSSMETKQSTIHCTSKGSSRTFSKAPELKEPDENRKQARRVRFGADQYC